VTKLEKKIRAVVLLAWLGRATIQAKRDKAINERNHVRFALTVPGSGQVRSRVLTWGAFWNLSVDEAWESFWTGKLRPTIKAMLVKMLEEEQVYAAETASAVERGVIDPADTEGLPWHHLTAALSPRSNGIPYKPSDVDKETHVLTKLLVSLAPRLPSTTPGPGRFTDILAPRLPSAAGALSMYQRQGLKKLETLGWIVYRAETWSLTNAGALIYKMHVPSVPSAPALTLKVQVSLSPDGDAECTNCGERFFSGTGHPNLALCAVCWKGA
jgi:hypothetical protein